MKRVDYIACPICGMSKVVFSPARADKGKPAVLKWADFDIATMEFVQIREGGGKTGTGKKGRGQGRGVGFTKIGAMSLQDAVNAGGPYLVIAQDIASQLQKAIAEFKRLGLIP